MTTAQERLLFSSPEVIADKAASLKPRSAAAFVKAILKLKDERINELFAAFNEKAAKALDLTLANHYAAKAA